jgi:hypothetical protein
MNSAFLTAQAISIMKEVFTMSRLPGKDYLVELPHPIPEGEKCTHNRGQWLVLWEGVYYSIQPSTQIQKDIWLDEAKRETGSEQYSTLRWLCHECGTIQMP